MTDAMRLTIRRRTNEAYCFSLLRENEDNCRLGIPSTPFLVLLMDSKELHSWRKWTIDGERM